MSNPDALDPAARAKTPPKTRPQDVVQPDGSIDWEAYGQATGVPVTPEEIGASQGFGALGDALGDALGGGGNPKGGGGPSPMSWWSQEAYAELPDAQSRDRCYAYLMLYSPDGVQQTESEQIVWRFLANPSKLEFSRSAKYNEAATFAAPKQDQHYHLSTGRTLKINEILFDLWQHGKSIQPTLDGIELLLEAKLGEGNFAPPVLSFVWGQRRFAPCVLTEVSWVETGWHGGEPARAALSITLLEIPKREARGDASIPEDERKLLEEEIAAAEREAEEAKKKLEKLKQPLTERQQSEGQDAAKKFLEENKDKLNPEVANLIESGEYKLETDQETGAVNLTNEKGEAIGRVGQWNGDKLNTEVGTLPEPPKPNETAEAQATEGDRADASSPGTTPPPQTVQPATPLGPAQ